MHEEVYTSLLRIDGGCFDLLRNIVVYLRNVYAECMAFTLFECCHQLLSAESFLLRTVWTESGIQGKPFAAETESSS